jgi:thiol-disulfide isomerase/thioredoxin
MGRLRKALASALAVGLLAACGNGGGAGASGQAPGFSLRDLEGREVSLAQFRGQVVLVDFWATWCPPCRMTIPDLIKFQQEFGGRGATVLGVNLDETVSDVPGFVKERGINYPVLLGAGKGVDEAYGVRGIPSFFLVDANGVIVRSWSGYSGAFLDELRSLVPPLLKK